MKYTLVKIIIEGILFYFPLIKAFYISVKSVIFFLLWASLFKGFLTKESSILLFYLE